MNDLSTFTLETIRKGGPFMMWLEKRRFEWVPLMAARLRLLLEGKSFVFLCDEKRSWYEEYFLKNINDKPYRPLVPIFALKALCDKPMQSKEDILLLNDLLDIAFPNGFVYFYVGTGLDKRANIAKSKDDSLLWLFDEELQNSFHLKSSDSDLDEKLISMYKLFDKSLEAILFSRVSL